MNMMKLATITVLALSAAAPAMAQSPAFFPAQRFPGSRIATDQPSGGSPGYQANTYVRRPSARTPTDVGNMAFPDPSQTPEGTLTSTFVGR